MLLAEQPLQPCPLLGASFGGGLKVPLPELLVPEPGLGLADGLVTINSIELAPTLDGHGPLAHKELYDSPLLNPALHGCHGISLSNKTKNHTETNQNKG